MRQTINILLGISDVAKGTKRDKKEQKRDNFSQKKLEENLRFFCMFQSSIKDIMNNK